MKGADGTTEVEEDGGEWRRVTWRRGRPPLPSVLPPFSPWGPWYPPEVLGANLLVVLWGLPPLVPSGPSVLQPVSAWVPQTPWGCQARY